MGLISSFRTGLGETVGFEERMDACLNLHLNDFYEGLRGAAGTDTGLPLRPQCGIPFKTTRAWTASTGRTFHEADLCGAPFNQARPRGGDDDYNTRLPLRCPCATPRHDTLLFTPTPPA